jgi:hypothetical protein
MSERKKASRPMLFKKRASGRRGNCTGRLGSALQRALSFSLRIYSQAQGGAQ